MRFNVLNRKVHSWVSIVIGLPLLIIIGSGLLLQIKKQWSWVQPPTQRGTGTIPVLALEEILARVQSVPHLQVAGWEDIDRLDLRPGRGLAKITLKSRWEVQVDLGTGEVLQVAYRRSDFIESLHDGSVFGGDWTKLAVFLPTGVGLFLLWWSGMWMFWFPYWKKWKRARTRPQQPVAES